MINSTLNKSVCLLLLGLLVSFNFCFGQTKDTIVPNSPTKFIFFEDDTSHSARKATIYSAALPGLGQVYNRKAWKVPLVYAAIGGCLTAAIINNQEYVVTRAELELRQKNTGLVFNEKYKFYDNNQLLALSDELRKWRDNMYIFTGLSYVLNIVDANVDGHLFNFNVSDDLSLNIMPYGSYNVILQQPVSGISLKLNFK